MSPKIGKNCEIANTARISENVIIEDNVKISDYCIIGLDNNNDNKQKLLIKKNTKINSHSTIYNGSEIGENNIIGHNVLIREKSIFGKNVQIGSYSDIEGYCTIEDYSKLHSCVHVGQHSKIMSFVYIFPYVVLTNDPIPPSDIRSGVILEPFSIICTRSTILPGVRIGFSSFIGANSLVNKDVNSEKIGAGNPFRVKGDISDIKIPNTNKSAYPWIDRFKKDYPKDIREIYKKMREEYLNSE
tara:strand:+ start:361 stop:1089 length:729 start_codon:yes stop_codon:yes gene_type:complete